MPWESSVTKMKAFQEFYKKVERIPDPLMELHYDPPMTYYNNLKTYPSFVPYDLYHNFDENFDSKSSRDDRRRLGPILENIYKEEEKKFVPITNQLWYGRPVLFENLLDFESRFNKPSATKDFYRRQGINITPELEQKPEH